MHLGIIYNHLYSILLGELVQLFNILKDVYIVSTQFHRMHCS